MKGNKLIVTICAGYLLLSFASCGQGSLSVSFPMIWSDVEVKDNWTPATAPNYEEYLGGSAFGYGVNLNYSFQPKFIIKDKHFAINIGAGYFKQRFEIMRPFNYNSQIFMIFYTDHYSYHCLQGNIGLTYKREVSRKLFLSGNFTFNTLLSFKQQYTPTRPDFPTQTDYSQINLGKMLSVGVGLEKQLGDRFSGTLQLLIPFYTRWRNDDIFNDDPSTFSRPNFSLGSVISVAYHLKKKQQ